MDIPQDSHNEDSGFARMLRDGNREPLVRAKETLKDRLLAKVRQDVLDDFADTEEVVEEALKGPAPEILDAVRVAYKQRLKEQLRGQVLHEVTEEGLEDEGASQNVDLDAVKQAWKGQLIERLRAEALEELRQEASAGVAGIIDDPQAQDTLDAVKSALKAQMMERLFQQAIAEIDHEVDLDPTNVLDTEETNAPETGGGRDGTGDADDTSLDEETEELRARTQAANPEAAPVSVPALEWTDEDAEDGEEMSELLDMHFWEEGEEDLPEDEVSDHPRDEEEADQGFFLEEEPGLNGAPGNALEIAFDGEAASDVSLEAGSVDQAGDGGWLHLDMKQPDVPDGEKDAAPVEAKEATSDKVDAGDETTVYYVYGIFSGPEEMLPDPLPEDGVVEGIPLTLISHEQMHAIVSCVPGSSFSEEALAERAEDTAWTDAITQAHDEAVEPFRSCDAFHGVPVLTVHPEVESVQDMLAEVHRLDVLERLEGRSEWHVVLYRNRETLHQHVVENSDTVQRLMAEIKNAPKGGASSIKKKMVAAIQEEMARVTDECASRVHEDLLESSEDADLGMPQHGLDAEKGEVVHAATYLLDDDAASLFNDSVTALRGAYADMGFALDVTGPRPPALLQQLQYERARA